MPEKPQSQSLAVLIDADNTSARHAHAIFEEIVKLGEANVRRIYGDFSGTRLAGWNKQIQSLAILQHQQRSDTTGKNASDIALVIDAMDLMHKGKLDGFCLVSSDSDFARLAQRLREDGLVVYGFGEGGEEQAKLVGFVGVRAHAIGKQIELAVLDAVFHVAAWAIGVFVEFPGRDLMAIEGSDEEAAALFVSGLVFDLGDDAPWPGPVSGFGDVVEIAVGADRLAGFDHGHGGLAAGPLCFPEQDIVACQAEDVIHGISLAPAHQVLAREAAVAAQQDVDVGPSFADHPDDAPDLVAVRRFRCCTSRC